MRKGCRKQVVPVEVVLNSSDKQVKSRETSVVYYLHGTYDLP